MPEMGGASSLKLESFNCVFSFKAGQVSPQVSGHPGPLPGLCKLVSLCFQFLVLLVALVRIGVAVALCWLVLQTDLWGVVS